MSRSKEDLRKIVLSQILAMGIGMYVGIPIASATTVTTPITLTAGTQTVDATDITVSTTGGNGGTNPINISGGTLTIAGQGKVVSIFATDSTSTSLPQNSGIQSAIEQTGGTLHAGSLDVTYNVNDAVSSRTYSSVGAVYGVTTKNSTLTVDGNIKVNGTYTGIASSYVDVSGLYFRNSAVNANSVNITMGGSTAATIFGMGMELSYYKPVNVSFESFGPVNITGPVVIDVNNSNSRGQAKGMYIGQASYESRLSTYTSGPITITNAQGEFTGIRLINLQPFTVNGDTNIISTSGKRNYGVFLLGGNTANFNGLLKIAGVNYGVYDNGEDLATIKSVDITTATNSDDNDAIGIYTNSRGAHVNVTDSTKIRVTDPLGTNSYYGAVAGLYTSSYGGNITAHNLDVDVSGNYATAIGVEEGQITAIDGTVVAHGTNAAPVAFVRNWEGRGIINLTGITTSAPDSNLSVLAVGSGGILNADSSNLNGNVSLIKAYSSDERKSLLQLNLTNGTTLTGWANTQTPDKKLIDMTATASTWNMNDGTSNVHNLTLDQGSLWTINNGTANITTQKMTNSTWNAMGGKSTVADLTAIDSVWTTDGNGTTATVTGPATITNNLANGIGLTASNQGAVSFQGTTNITTTGNNSVAVQALSGGTVDIPAAATAVINSSGSGSKGLAATGNGSTINLDTGTVTDTGSGADLYAADNGVINLTKTTAKGTVALAGNSGGTVNANGSTITGTAIAGTDAGTNLVLSNNSTWNMTGDSSLSGLTDSVGSSVNMRANSITGDTYEKLTTTNYTGNGGNLIMDTDLQSQSIGDKMHITGASSGSSYVQIHDASLLNGSEVTGTKNLLLVSGASVGTTFQLVGKNLDAGGLWETTPTIKIGTEALDENGNPVGTADQWYLTMLVKKANPGTQTVIDNFGERYGIWRGVLTDDTLRKRLGDLRYDKNNMGLWTRIKGGQINGTGFDTDYTMYQIGYDKMCGNTAYGVAFDYTRGRGSYNNGSSDTTMGNLSLYATNYRKGPKGMDGTYSDLVLKVGKETNDLTTHGTYPDYQDYGAWAYSASYELGKTMDMKNNWFFEPETQLVVGRLGGADYTTDRGTNISKDAVNSVLGRVGFVVGRKAKDKDFYAKFNAWHEFNGTNDADMFATNGEKMYYRDDFKGTWYEFGLGGNVVLSNGEHGPRCHFYGDVLRTFGSSIAKNWQLNLGLRWELDGRHKPVQVVEPVRPVAHIVPVKETYYNTVYFDFDEDQPKAGEQAKVAKFAETAKANPDTTYALVGNTDAVGTDTYNMNLSKRRVENVKNEAEKLGVPASRMQDSYLGKSHPAQSNDTAAGRAANRRVEIYEHKADTTAQN